MEVGTGADPVKKSTTVDRSRELADEYFGGIDPVAVLHARIAAMTTDEIKGLLFISAYRIGACLGILPTGDEGTDDVLKVGHGILHIIDAYDTASAVSIPFGTLVGRA